MGTEAKADVSFEKAGHFDYESVPPSVAKFLRGQAERIRHGYTTSIIQAGKALIEAKRHLSHGGFIRWVRSEVGIPVRTAQVYMQVAQWAKGKSAAVAHLPPSILYILCGRGTPEEFATNLLKRHEAGEKIDAGAARAELRALRGAKGKSANSKMEMTFDEPPAPQIEADHANTESAVALEKAIDILVNSLSSLEFDEVRNIMTSKSVLEDPNLARNISTAFLLAAQPGERRLRLSYEGQRHFDGEKSRAA
jgi:hypothetical protein